MPSAIFLERNPTYQSKTKHNAMQYHFDRGIENNKVLCEKVDTAQGFDW